MEPSQAQLLRQIGQISKRDDNKTCAECAQRESCWAAIIHPPVRGGRELGIFCCGRCYKPHSLLGTNICVVKSLSMATEWTQEEVTIFDQSGNELVNSIYEANLSVGERNSEKEIVTFDRQEEAKVRSAYISKKYQERRYFSQDEYSTKMKQIRSKDNSNNKQERAGAARGNRRAMLMGGALSVRNLPTTTKSTAVLQRAASKRQGVMRKCNSDRNLMGRLNGISLASSKPSATTMSTSKSSNLLTEKLQANSSTEEWHKLHNLETSSQKTAGTESSDSSYDSSTMASQQSPVKQPQHKVGSMEKVKQMAAAAADSDNNSKRPIRKTSSMEESLATKSLRDSYQKAQPVVSPMKKSSSGPSVTAGTNGGNDQEEENQTRPSLFSGMKKSSSGPSLFSSMMGSTARNGGNNQEEENQTRPSLFNGMKKSPSGPSLFSSMMSSTARNGGNNQEGGEDQPRSSLFSSTKKSPSGPSLFSTVMGTSGYEDVEADPNRPSFLGAVAISSSARSMFSTVMGGGGSGELDVEEASQSSSPDLMQLPCNLRVQRASASSSGEGDPRLRKALGARNPVSSNAIPSSPPNPPEMHRSQSECGPTEPPEMLRSQSEGGPAKAPEMLGSQSEGGTGLNEEGSLASRSISEKNNNNSSCHLEAASAIGSMRKSLSNRAPMRPQGDASQLVAASTLGSAEGESPLQAFLQQKNMRKSPSGKHLVMGQGRAQGNSSLGGGGRPQLGKSMSMRQMERTSPRSATKSWSNVQNIVRNDSMDHSPGDMRNWSAEQDNLAALGGGNAARKAARRRSPNTSNQDAPLPIIKKSLSGPNLLAAARNNAPKSSMKRSLSGKNLSASTDNAASKPRMRKALSGRNLMASVGHDAPSRISRMHSSFSALNSSLNGSFNGSNPHSPSRRKATRTIPIEAPEANENALPRHSIRVEDLGRRKQSVLCPSRRDMYDPEAEGLAVLLQDSDPSMQNLRMDNSQLLSHQNDPQASRQLSPARSPLSPKTTKLSGEESTDSERPPIKRISSGRSLSPCRSTGGSSSNRSLSPRPNTRSAGSPPHSRDSSSSRSLSPRRNSQDKADRTYAIPTRSKSIESQPEEQMRPMNTRPALKKSNSMRNPKSDTFTQTEEEKRSTNTRPALKKSNSMRNPKSDSRRVPSSNNSFSSTRLDSSHSSHDKSKRDSGHRSLEIPASSVGSSEGPSRDRRDKDKSTRDSGNRSWEKFASSLGSSARSRRGRRDKEKSKRDSGHRSWEKSASSLGSSGRSRRDRRDKDRKEKSSRSKRDEESDRKSSRKDERRSSKDRIDDSEIDTDKKESERSERHRSDRESRKHDKKSRDRESRDSKHTRDYDRDKEDSGSERDSRYRRRSSNSKEDRLEREVLVERFIASVGDLNDENFWVKMMDKWEEAAQ